MLNKRKRCGGQMWGSAEDHMGKVGNKNIQNMVMNSLTINYHVSIASWLQANNSKYTTGKHVIIGNKFVN